MVEDSCLHLVQLMCVVDFLGGGVADFFFIYVLVIHPGVLFFSLGDPHTHLPSVLR